MITVNGINIQYIEKGTGYPLILIHGLSDSFLLWTPLLQEFSHQYKTIAMDVRGHGYSSKPDAPYTVTQFSHDLQAFCNALSIQDCHLAGHSMGAAIAQQFASDCRERVRSLVLLSPISSRDHTFAANLTKLQESITTGGTSAFFDEAIKLGSNTRFRISKFRSTLRCQKNLYEDKLAHCHL